MAMVRKTIDVNQKLTQEQISQIENASKSPVVFDEDSPELSQIQMDKIAELVRQRDKSNRKETISLRLSASKIQMAKQLGKGYTTILGRILENVLSDEEALKKYAVAH